MLCATQSIQESNMEEYLRIVLVLVVILGSFLWWVFKSPRR